MNKLFWKEVDRHRWGMLVEGWTLDPWASDPCNPRFVTTEKAAAVCKTRFSGAPQTNGKHLCTTHKSAHHTHFGTQPSTHTLNQNNWLLPILLGILLPTCTCIWHCKEACPATRSFDSSWALQPSSVCLELPTSGANCFRTHSSHSWAECNGIVVIAFLNSFLT